MLDGHRYTGGEPYCASGCGNGLLVLPEPSGLRGGASVGTKTPLGRVAQLAPPWAQWHRGRSITSCAAAATADIARAPLPSP